MNPENKTARLAGLFYLILIISGVISLVYIPSRLIVWENASKTVENIRNSEWLFRIGIVCGTVTFIMFIFLPLALYRLLHPVNRTHAILMVVFALVSIPISFTNIQHNFSVLTLLSKPDYLQGMGAEQLQEQVMLHLAYYNNGIQIASIFWGLWLFPFGYLVYKSGFLPKVLGIFLMAGCFGYLIDFLGQFLFPGFGKSVIPSIVSIPSAIGEFGICLWLLIMGTNKLKIGRKSL